MHELIWKRVHESNMEARTGTHDRRGVIYTLAAAVLFGASTPCAKSLLSDVAWVMMPGLLYLGSGVGLGLWYVIRGQSKHSVVGVKLSRQDMPWVVAVVTAGGVVGPLLLMWGLARTPASTSALLLNLEGLFTAVLAWLVFHESCDRRVVLGMLALVVGAALLGYEGTPQVGVPWGIVAIAGACAAWAVDNNLTRRISSSDPVQIGTIKGLGAGITNLTVALLAGSTFPAAHLTVLVGVVGLATYGLSIVLFILGLRHLGAARVAAYFSTAPFVGAGFSILFLGELPTPLWGLRP
jgi:drug/metabolite transporter (DMT)-like permease